MMKRKTTILNKIVCFTVSLILTLLAFTGCDNSNKAPKYAKMAIEYIQSQVPVDISESVYYVKTTGTPKNYSYYSPFEEKNVNEYNNIIARVYLKGESTPYPIVVFIGKNAEKEYDSNKGKWNSFEMFLKMSKVQVEASVESSYTTDYLDAVKTQMWKEQHEKNKAFIPENEDLTEWIAVSNKEL